MLSQPFLWPPTFHNYKMVIVNDMPELPDVEVMRKYLAETSLHKEVKDVEIFDGYVVKEVSSDTFKSCLTGVRFEKAERRGKFLEVFTDSEYDLAIHFGMTGCLEYVPSGRDYQKYVRVAFKFQNNYDLRYVAKRKLGGLYLVENGDFNSIATIKNMGPEPLDPNFTFDKFQSLSKNRSAKLKALFLDQSFIAGIGNVYADEVLFQAGIRPQRKISELSQQELCNLFKMVKYVLKTAVHYETNFEGLKDAFLVPHRNPEGTCPKCGNSFQTAKISSRTSYWCEHCQK